MKIAIGMMAFAVAFLGGVLVYIIWSDRKRQAYFRKRDLSMAEKLDAVKEDQKSITEGQDGNPECRDRKPE